MTPDRLLSARDVEKVLGIPASTVRTWYARRHTTGLYDHGRDHRNAPMFRATDLLAIRTGRTLRDPLGCPHLTPRTQVTPTWLKPDRGHRGKQGRPTGDRCT